MAAVMQEIDVNADTLLEHLVNVNPTMYFKELTVIKLRYEEVSEHIDFADNSRFTTFNPGNRKVHLYVRDSVINEPDGYAVGTLMVYNPVKDSFLVRFPAVGLDPYQASFNREELYDLAVPFKNGCLTYNLDANKIDVREL